MEETDIRRHLEASRYDEAFSLLHEQLKEKVFRLAFSILRDEARAEDAAQDVFVKIWKGLPAYHGGASLSTWIYTITRNTCLTEITRHSRRATISLHEPGMEAVADDIKSLQWLPAEPGSEMDVKVLLAQLPSHYRQVITLFYLEQKAYEEVAAMLGLPLGTVKTLIFRAKKELLRINARRAQSVSTTAGQSRTNSKPTASAIGIIDLLESTC